MAKAMQFDSTIADAYAEFEIPGPQSTVWVSVDLFFSAAALTAWAGTPSGLIVGLFDAGHSINIDYLYLDTGWEPSTATFSPDFTPFPAPVAGAWVTVEMKHVASGTDETYFDTVKYGEGADPYGTDTKFLRVGLDLTTNGVGPAADETILITNVKAGTTRGGSDLFAWADTSTDLSAWTTVVGDATVVTIPSPPAPASRFYHGYQWRTIITDLDSQPITCLERLSANRQITYGLNQPAVTTGQVPSDDPRVNIPHGGVPELSFNNRLAYMFRRDGPGTAQPWHVRFAGIVTQLEDTAQSDQPYSNFTAYDPWQYLFARAVKNADGSLVGPEGLQYTGITGDNIVSYLILNTILYDGPCLVELGAFETTAPLTINFQQGSSVGDALKQLTQTGTLDILFQPVYDPVAKPGICSTVRVFAQAGSVKADAVMSWGVGRQVKGISDLFDGSQMANDVQFYNGQGGPPVAPQTDAASIARFGVWSAQQFFPAQTDAPSVEAVAALQLDLRKNGRQTVDVSPNSLIAPIPLIDYNLGDRLPVYATRRLRQPIPTT